MGSGERPLVWACAVGPVHPVLLPLSVGRKRSILTTDLARKRPALAAADAAHTHTFHSRGQRDPCSFSSTRTANCRLPPAVAATARTASRRSGSSAVRSRWSPRSAVPLAPFFPRLLRKSVFGSTALCASYTALKRMVGCSSL